MDRVHHIVSADWEKNSNLSDDSDKTGTPAVLAIAAMGSDSGAKDDGAVVR